MTVSNWIRKNASTILTFLGAGGVIATAVLAVKATPKAMDKIQTAQIDKGEDILKGNRAGEIKKNDDGSYEMPKLTVAETVQVCWKEYIPTIAVGISSLACIFGANALNQYQQASIAAAYTALASAFEGYRDKVTTICGPGTDMMIEKSIEQEKNDVKNDRPPWNEMQTFYLSCGRRPEFFDRTMEQILRAEYELNRRLIINGEVVLNEFFDILGLDHVEDGDKIGWDCYVENSFYGYSWIDFIHRYHSTDDGLMVCAIDTPTDPYPLSEEGYESVG